MTHTAEALKNIAPDRFEDLASAVLRRAEPAYRYLIHPGKNTKGETVRSPVDGISYVPESAPPHFVIFHYTVAEDLERKWLHVRPPSGKGSQTPDGDVVKATHWAKEQRETTPDTRVTLVLACNEIPGDETIARAGQLCTQHGIRLEVWDFTRLLDFLDNEPDGQWLRKKYLEIAQERLSFDLLRDLSIRSCELYSHFEHLGEEGLWINRTLDEDLRRQVWGGGKPVTLLIAGSGKGKTTASYRLLKKHLDAGGIGLWIEPRFVESATTAESAVEAVLRSLSPEIETGSGGRAFEFAAGRGLLLIADDVNRSPRPADLVRKVAGWSETSSSGMEYRILCPVWPQVLDLLLDRHRESLEPLCLHGESFLPEEGVAALERRATMAELKLTRVEAEDLANEFGHDPLLIALWGEGQTGLGKTAGLPVAFFVIEEFVQRSLQRLAAQTADSRPAVELWDALLDLSRKMLQERRLAPTWRDVQQWFRNEQGKLEALRQILWDRVLCRLGNEVSPAPFLFRHDRVRDHLLARALREWMEEGNLPEPLLEEPHFAEVLGQALATASLPSDHTWRVAERNPLALACALRFFRTPETPFQEALAESLREWIHDRSEGERSLPHLCWAMQKELARTDSPLVLELAGLFKEFSWDVLIARLRNGDVQAGAQLYGGMGINAGWISSLARHAADRQGSNFLTALKRLLQQPYLSAESRAGALYLAGWLAEPRLLPAIETSWSHQTSVVSPALLAGGIWAAARCSKSKPTPALETMLTAWMSLSDEKKEPDSFSDRFWVGYTLAQAFAEHPPHEALVRYLALQGQSESLQRHVFNVMADMNHPDAVEFVVQSAAHKDRKAEEEGKGPLFWHFTIPWDRPWGRRLRQECLDRLRRLWEREDSDSHLKLHAFSLWLTGVTEEDLPTIQKIEPSSPLFRAARDKRKRLGDLTIVPYVLQCLSTEKHPDYCWFDCQRIWCDELKVALDSYLEHLEERLTDGWDFKGTRHVSATLLADIPSTDAHELLLKHWGYLKRSSIFVQSALAVTTPECLAAVAEIIKECPEPKKLLQYVASHLGIGWENREARVTELHLEALRPYLDLVDEHSIRKIWMFCNRRRLFAWRRKHLDPLLSSKLREQLGLDDTRLKAELDSRSKEKMGWAFMDRWMDRFEERGEPPERALEFLTRWLQETKSIEAFDLVSHCLIFRGKRRDLSLLETSGLPLDNPQVKKIIKDTRFAVFRRTLE